MICLIMKKIILIGLGKQMIKDHYVAVCKRKDIKVVAFIDVVRYSYDEHLSKTGIPFFYDLDEAIENTKPDCAIVSVPHYQYYDILYTLAKNKIATLKENLSL
jgi:predicted dehydrogenase